MTERTLNARLRRRLPVLLVLILSGCTEAERPDITTELARAERLRQASKPLQAMAELGKAAGQVPNNPIVRRRLAEFYQWQHQWSAAEAEYRAAISIEREPESLVGLAALLRHQQRAGEATRFYQAAVELDPDFEPAVDGLCRALLDSGDFQGALDPCVRAAELIPSDLGPKQRLGQALLKLGKVREAALVLLDRPDIEQAERDRILAELENSTSPD